MAMATTGSAQLSFSDQEDPRTRRADIVKVDTTLESWRDAGFDITAAVGEIVDNSVEAAAKVIRVNTYPAGSKAKKIESIAFADDGIGIDPSILANVPALGFSTRYNQRNGLGRFGVGMTLAALSLAKRFDVYTRVEGDPHVWHSYLDLVEINEHTQTEITCEQLSEFPEEYADIMTDSEGDSLPSGTLVVWSKVDRLESGGKFNTDIQQRLYELQKFLARAYRRFIDQGLRIELNGRVIELHDPTFQLENQRVTKRLGHDVRGEVISRDTIDLDGHVVTLTVTLAPEELNAGRGKGGSQLPKDFHIPENEGKVSFLRQGREINYEFPPYMIPGGVKWGDRYVGIEVEFPAMLDEYFEVRNVKKGVMPVDKLRKHLKEKMDRPMEAARRRYKKMWDEMDHKNRTAGEDHSESQGVVAEVEKTAPRGRAGGPMGDEEFSQKVNDMVKELELDPEADKEKIDKLRQAINELPITVADSTWPGKELFDITHLNGKAVMKINHGHPFIKEVYDPIHDLIDTGTDEIDSREALRLLRRAEVGIELLLMAYAKAENMHKDPDLAFSDLRSHWGTSSSAYMTAALRDLP